MNLILFRPGEIARPLPRSDSRAEHLLRVLRRQPGDEFDAGLIDGPRGKGRLLRITHDSIDLEFRWGEAPPPLPPITLLAAFTRPQTCRSILREGTSLGADGLFFFPAEKGEPSYASSRLWSTGEYRQRLIEGAQQAFCTRLPRVATLETLAGALAALPPERSRLALDNYEATAPLRSRCPARGGAVLAIGPERGWSETERLLLRKNGFTLVHLGPRVLRTETACVAGLALLNARLKETPP